MENDYKVVDIDLADFGRKEISLAENEMPAHPKSTTHPVPVQSRQSPCRGRVQARHRWRGVRLVF